LKAELSTDFAAAGPAILRLSGGCLDKMVITALWRHVGTLRGFKEKIRIS
jgi:hypothetical protein